MFPSLVNCCTIDWFTEWPEDALEKVATKFLEDMDMDDEVINTVFREHFLSKNSFTVNSQFKARAIIKTRSSEVGLNSSWAIIRVRAIISTSIFLLTK